MSRALGRYELLRPLARGGMAEVYLARRRAAGIEKWLVVKRMRPETLGDPRFLDLFVREARLSMSLVHQNIVPVFDFGKIDDQVFLAMERVEGKDLGSSLARAPDHRLPPLVAAFVAAECCQALDYAHLRKGPDGVALGIVHRDVTPRNVLLSWSGEVKLSDFGIAALAGDATSRLLGTPLYMAPEQARSEPIDPRADLYAIGLVLREAVTGRRARPGSDRDAILEAARRGALIPWQTTGLGSDRPSGGPDERRSSAGEPRPAPEAALPEALIAIIDRATRAAPDERYPDARSMLEELDSFIVGQRAAHRVESPARQLAAWLASVWDGARDDLESDAAIDAEALVSFLDDGAFDVLSTGTVRSLAATSVEDPHVAAADPAPAPAAAPARATGAGTSPAVATGGRRTAGAGIGPAIGSPARTTGMTGRPSRISSSNATVASGSFHVISAPGPRSQRSPHRADDPAALPRTRRRISPLVGAAIVALVVGTAAFAITAAYRTADQARPSPLVTSASPRAALPPAPTPPAPTAPAPTSPAPTAPAPTSPAPTSPAPTAPAPTAGPASSQPTMGRPRRPGSSGAAAHSPGAAPPPNREPHPGAVEAPGAAPPGPPLCRVRINLTPWAYYMVDNDSVRHETPATVELAPGPHRLHVWNPELHIERDIALDVPADRETMNYSEPLQPTTLPVTPRAAQDHR
jgi:serine/threonine protein kinase